MLTALLLLVSSAHARKITLDGVAWLAAVEKAGIHELIVCGSGEIHPAKASLKTEVLLGKPKAGYFFTGLFLMDEYWKLMKATHLGDLEATLKERMKDTHLWRVSAEGEVKDLGAPTRFQLEQMKSTVRDCVEGAKTTLGGECHGNASCCMEKFVGPRIYWGETMLRYSPDPSVRLRVAGERQNRFCDVQERVELVR